MSTIIHFYLQLNKTNTMNDLTKPLPVIKIFRLLPSLTNKKTLCRPLLKQKIKYQSQEKMKN